MGELVQKLDVVAQRKDMYTNWAATEAKMYLWEGSFSFPLCMSTPVIFHG